MAAVSLDVSDLRDLVFHTTDDDFHLLLASPLAVTPNTFAGAVGEWVTHTSDALLLHVAAQGDLDEADVETLPVTCADPLDNNINDVAGCTSPSLACTTPTDSPLPELGGVGGYDDKHKWSTTAAMPLPSPPTAMDGRTTLPTVSNASRALAVCSIRLDVLLSQPAFIVGNGHSRYHAFHSRSNTNGSENSIAETSYGDADRLVFSMRCRLSRSAITRLLELGCASAKDVLNGDATMLHYACDRQQRYGAAVVRMILAAGADMNAVTRSGSTALHIAVCTGHLTAIHALLEGLTNTTTRTTASATVGKEHDFNRSGDPSAHTMYCEAFDAMHSREGVDAWRTNRAGETALTVALRLRRPFPVVTQLVAAEASTSGSSMYAWRVWWQAVGATTGEACVSDLVSSIMRGRGGGAWVRRYAGVRAWKAHSMHVADSGSGSNGVSVTGQHLYLPTSNTRAATYSTLLDALDDCHAHYAFDKPLVRIVDYLIWTHKEQERASVRNAAAVALARDRNSGSGSSSSAGVSGADMSFVSPMRELRQATHTAQEAVAKLVERLGSKRATASNGVRGEPEERGGRCNRSIWSARTSTSLATLTAHNPPALIQQLVRLQPKTQRHNKALPPVHSKLQAKPPVHITPIATAQSVISPFVE